MSWENFRTTFLNFQSSLYQARIISLLSEEILKDFPTNIPENIMKDKWDRMKKFTEDVLDLRKLVVEKDKEKILEKAGKIEFDLLYSKDEELISSFLGFGIIQAKMDNEFWETDVKNISRHQEIITYNSLLDSFLNDCIRSICYKKPEILKISKMLSYEEILNQLNWNGLFDYMIEKHVRNEGWGELFLRIKKILKEFNLDINISEDEKILKEFDIVRNMLIHNGGKISEEYLILKGLEKDKINEKIGISREFIREIFEVLIILSSELYVKISEKYFNVEYKILEHDLTTTREHAIN